VREERAQAFSHEPFADVRVAVAVRPERRLRIVDMDSAQAVQADAVVDLRQRLVDSGRVGHVDTRDPEVAGIETDAEVRVPSEPIDEDGQLVDRPADRAAGAGRVLEQEPGRVRAPAERPLEGRKHAFESDLEAGAEMRADMEDDSVGLDRAGDVDRVLEGRDRLLVDRLVRSRQVDEVERVADDGTDAGLGAARFEALEVVGVVVRRPPRAGALREDLDGLAPDALDAVDRRVDPARGRDVSPEEHRDTLDAVSVRVRFAPSPTGLLHIGGVRTALFNWLHARHESGEFLLRVENTDVNREVAESVEQIQRSLAWLGLDWDGEVTFQLDRLERHQEVARHLLEEGKAYEDEGAIRFRMPDEGTTSWDDAIRGRIEFPNEKLEDVVLLRSDGRPTYNFAAPLDDADTAITHVIRGDDHVSNTPKQIQILGALDAPVPVYAHLPNVLGPDGRKLSKRHGAVSVEEFQRDGYLAPALMNYLALLGWSYDEKTTVMSRDELVERFTLDRVGASPATFDYAKLEWLNGVYLRAMTPEEYAEALVTYLREQGYDWEEQRVRQAAPLAQGKIALLGQFPEFVRFLFEPVQPDPGLLDGSGPILTEARQVLEAVEPFSAERIEAELRALAERLGLKPRAAFQPIRVAVTGSKVSPGLFESIELLGRDETLARLSAAAGVGA
jgi:glutamyl/glutaminyl-tRNA synthetase